jgi:hypothetical protein
MTDKTTAEKVKELYEAKKESDPRAGRQQKVKELYESKTGTVRNLSRAFVGAAADMADLPGDALAGAVNLLQKPMTSLMRPEVAESLQVPSGGFRQAAEASGATIPKEDIPDTLATKAGQFAGETLPLAALAPFGASLKVAQGATGVLPKAGNFLKGVLKDAGKTAIKRPAQFYTSETLIAGSAGAGAYLAAEKFPDSPVLAEFFGALGAGALATASPTLFIGRKATDLYHTAKSFFSESSGKRRASQVVIDNATDPKKALESLEFKAENDFDKIPEIFKLLTPAQKSQDAGMLPLQAYVMSRSTSFRIQGDKQISELNAALHGALATPVREGMKPTRAKLKDRVLYIKSLMQKSLRIAADKADDDVLKIGPKITRAETERMVAAQLDVAETLSGDAVSKLWKALPEDVPVSAEIPVKVFRKELAKTGVVYDPEDIDEIVYTLFGRFKEVTKKVGGVEVKSREFIPGTMSSENLKFKDLLEARKILNRRIRTERSLGPAHNGNKVRIMGDLQASIIKQIEDFGDQVPENLSDAYKLALAASREHAKLFTQGPVGKLLSYRKTGETLIEDSLTLTNTLSGDTRKATVNLQHIKNASQNNPETMGAIEDWVKSSFEKAAVFDDVVNIKKAEVFLRKNDELLSNFPNILKDIKQAMKSGKGKDILARRFATFSENLGNPNISKAAVIIGEDPISVFEKVAKSQSPGPEKAIDEFLKLVKNDQTGESLQGFQATFIEYLRHKASIPVTDSNQKKILSGFHLSDLINGVDEFDGVGVMARKILTPEQFDRVQQVANVAKIANAQNATFTALEAMVNVNASKSMGDFAGIFGAQMAAYLPGRKTIQGPGIIANKMRALVNSKMKDPAAAILNDAIMGEDPALLAALLKPIKSEEDLNIVFRQLGAWRAVAIMELGKNFSMDLPNPIDFDNEKISDIETSPLRPQRN